MLPRHHGTSIVLGSFLVLSIVPSLAGAQAQSSEQQYCINAMNKDGGRVAERSSRTYSRCFSDAESNKLGSATVAECHGADARGDIDSAIVRLIQSEEEDCTNDPPSFGYVGSSRIADVATAKVVDFTNDVFGAAVGPDFAGLTTQERRCRHVIGRSLYRMIQMRLREFRECKKNGLGTGAISSRDGIANCIETVLGSAVDLIERTYDKIDRQVLDRCNGLDLAELFPGVSCSGSSLATLARCIDDRADCNTCQLLASLDGVEGETDCDLADDGLSNSSCIAPLPGICPTSIKVRSRSRDGDGANTRINAGHRGLNHNLDVASGQVLEFDVSCANASWPCGDCTILGLHGKQGRCANDPTIPCDTIDAVDTDDCGAGQSCQVAFPLTQNIAFSDLCHTPRMASTPNGYINNESGAMVLDVDVATDVYFPIGQFYHCPGCLGDDLRNDGNRNGTCHGGQRSGLSCDANAVDPIQGDMSQDCPPSVGARLSGADPLFQRLHLRTGTATLTAAVPCDPPLDATNCPCAVCAGNPTIPCASDAECGGAGPCNANHTNGAFRAPNPCSDEVCTDLPGNGAGICLDGPWMTGCDGLVDGEGNLLLGFCNNDADCDAYDPACPGNDCGICIGNTRGCFADTISVSGVQDTHNPVLADVSCVAGSTVNLVPNVDSGGYPGPESILLGVELERVYP